VHVGGGRVGISTGAGPVSAYVSLGGSRRGGSQDGWAPYDDYEADLRRARREQRLDEVQRLHEQFVRRHWLAHRQEFSPLHKPTVTPEKLDVEGRVAAARRAAVGNISMLHIAARRAARGAAEASARERAERDQELENEKAAQHQELVDAAWDRLVGNDPVTVLTTLEEAFADNKAPAAPLDCYADGITLLMRLPLIDAVVPLYSPDQTPTGRPTIREYSKTERQDLYIGAMLSHAYATVAEAFAVAPGIRGATVLVINADATQLTPIYAAHAKRAEFEAGAWLGDFSATLAPEHLINVRGRTDELAPLDLKDEPDLSEVVRQLASDLNVNVNPLTRLAASVPGKDFVPGDTTVADESAQPVNDEHGTDNDDAEPPKAGASAQPPARITQGWLTANVRQMTDTAYDDLQTLLRKRGWTETELAERVGALRRIT
jgi:hypothetical protein